MPPTFPDLRPTPGQFPAEEDEAVDDEEDRRREGFGEQHPKSVLEDDPGDAGGIVATTRSQPSRSVGVVTVHVPGRVEQAGDDRFPLLPEEDDQSKRSPSDVERHDESEPERLRFAFGGDEVVPAEERREHDGVAEARDGEELRDALKHPPRMITWR